MDFIRRQIDSESQRPKVRPEAVYGILRQLADLIEPPTVVAAPTPVPTPAPTPAPTPDAKPSAKPAAKKVVSPTKKAPVKKTPAKKA